ncbi:MAG: hypothetical protein B6D55_08545 [Candidatus Omnitrophica bacterium 4484_70.2]|nr:MAG: hypothetical protein B6D55_08545 [Candidatus Omnitrophica bacterium 4484_70.2]
MLRILNYTFLGNTLLDYLIFLLILCVGLLFIRIFKKIILKRLKKWAEKTQTTVDDFIVNSIIEKTALPLQEALERSLKGILRVAKVLVWGLAIVFFLDNLGFKVSTVLAGLGIGGVAVALAAQAILKDLFSYFSIIFDRPFEVGDFIIVDNFLGTVEYIGIKTTRIRSLGGEQLILSNTDLTSSRVRNYKRMEKRRVVFQFGVTYDTPVEKLKKIPKIVEEIIKSVKDTIFDRAHFFSYGDFSLIFEVVYYVLGSSYNKYMDIQQEINLKLKEVFEKEKIEFAFPTQTLYIHSLNVKK